VRRSARRRQSAAGCNHAPRPGSRRRGSGTSTPSAATTLSSSDTDPRERHPTQVRTGPSIGASRRSRSRVRATDHSTAPPAGRSTPLSDDPRPDAPPAAAGQSRWLAESAVAWPTRLGGWPLATEFFSGHDSVRGFCAGVGVAQHLPPRGPAAGRPGRGGRHRDQDALGMGSVGLRGTRRGRHDRARSQARRGGQSVRLSANRPGPPAGRRGPAKAGALSATNPGVGRVPGRRAARGDLTSYLAAGSWWWRWAVHFSSMWPNRHTARATAQVRMKRATTPNPT